MIGIPAPPVIINCTTGEVKTRPVTAEDIAHIEARQQAAILREATEAQKEAERQAAITELSKTPEGQQILKAMGVEPTVITP